MHFMWEVYHRGAAGLAELVAGLHQDAILIRQTPGRFLKDTIQELVDGTPPTHDAEENGSAGSDGGQHFVEGLSRSVEDVAQWAAECGNRVEGRQFEAREIGDVEQPASLDRILVPGGDDAFAVEVKLSRRDVADKNAGSEPGQLDGEAPGTRADLEHSVAGMDPTGLKAFMKL
jgi:hypothetical protein